jgi:hypothetical protein
MKRIVLNIIILISVIGHPACSSNVKNAYQVVDSNYTQWYYSQQRMEMLLLACVVFRADELKMLDKGKTNGFYDVSKEYSTFCCNQYDSLVNAYVNMHKEVYFYSPKSVQSIKSFMDSYFIVSDIIFGSVDSDDKEVEALLLEKRMDKVPEFRKIFRSYVSEGRKLNSLSSSEGSTMFIHFAYYISTLSNERRIELLKDVL